jgi:hypothetical protein
VAKTPSAVNEAMLAQFDKSTPKSERNPSNTSDNEAAAKEFVDALSGDVRVIPDTEEDDLDFLDDDSVYMNKPPVEDDQELVLVLPKNVDKFRSRRYVVCTGGDSADGLWRHGGLIFMKVSSRLKAARNQRICEQYRRLRETIEVLGEPPVDLPADHTFTVRGYKK